MVGVLGFRVETPRGGCLVVGCGLGGAALPLSADPGPRPASRLGGIGGTPP